MLPTYLPCLYHLDINDRFADEAIFPGVWKKGPFQAIWIKVTVRWFGCRSGAEVGQMGAAPA